MAVLSREQMRQLQWHPAAKGRQKLVREREVPPSRKNAPQPIALLAALQRPPVPGPAGMAVLSREQMRQLQWLLLPIHHHPKNRREQPGPGKGSGRPSGPNISSWWSGGGGGGSSSSLKCSGPQPAPMPPVVWRCGQAASRRHLSTTAAPPIDSIEPFSTACS
ncbi:uncharacterized protein LOC144798315 [Lissotriton helveticus]